MTRQERAIRRLATNEDALYLLEKIKRIDENMGAKTANEQKTANREVEFLLKQITERIGDVK